MKNNKKEDDEHSHFVEATYPENEPWKTNIYFGVKDGTGSHAHLVASGATVLYFRDMNGSVIINNTSS